MGPANEEAAPPRGGLALFATAFGAGKPPAVKKVFHNRRVVLTRIFDTSYPAGAGDQLVTADPGKWSYN
jgi:hypothetical protein